VIALPFVDISENVFSTFPPEVLLMGECETLNAAHNLFTSIPDMSSFIMLTSLDLR
jgi:hypothetical protein